MNKINIDRVCINIYGCEEAAKYSRTNTINNRSDRCFSCGSQPNQTISRKRQKVLIQCCPICYTIDNFLNHQSMWKPYDLDLRQCKKEECSCTSDKQKEDETSEEVESENKDCTCMEAEDRPSQENIDKTNELLRVTCENRVYMNSNYQEDHCIICGFRYEFFDQKSKKEYESEVSRNRNKANFFELRTPLQVITEIVSCFLGNDISKKAHHYEPLLFDVPNLEMYWQMIEKSFQKTKARQLLRQRIRLEEVLKGSGDRS